MVFRAQRARGHPRLCQNHFGGVWLLDRNNADAAQATANRLKTQSGHAAALVGLKKDLGRRNDTNNM